MTRVRFLSGRSRYICKVSYHWCRPLAYDLRLKLENRLWRWSHNHRSFLIGIPIHGMMAFIQKLNPAWSLDEKKSQSPAESLPDPGCHRYVGSASGWMTWVALVGKINVIFLGRRYGLLKQLSTHIICYKIQQGSDFNSKQGPVRKGWRWEQIGQGWTLFCRKGRGET